MRTVYVGGLAWSFQVGRGSTVILSPEPERRKYVVSHPHMMGLTVGTVERTYWKTYVRGVRIDPSNVKAYIEKHLAERT